MDDWRTILTSWGPREDAHRSFYPDQVEHEGPVLLNENGALTAAFVAARVLRALAARRGTRLTPGQFERLEKLVSRGLSEEVVHHCEAEAELVLQWLDDPPESLDPLDAAYSRTPELDVMMASDLESRLSVATFAIEEGYDLELEYFDEESGTWPRIRAHLLEIEDEEAADDQTALLLEDRGGAFSVPLRVVRWLMPVAPLPSIDEDHRGGDVLEFPGRSDD
jgi:hypothetical protein